MHEIEIRMHLWVKLKLLANYQNYTLSRRWVRHLIEFVKDLKHCWSLIWIMSGTRDNQIVNEWPLGFDLLQQVTIPNRVRKTTSDDLTQQYSITVDIYFGCLWWTVNFWVKIWERFWGCVYNSTLSKGPCKSSYIC